MKAKRFLSLLVSLTLLLSVRLPIFEAHATTPSTSDFDCLYKAGEIDRNTNLIHYGSSSVIRYSEEEAVQKGIPEGFTNEVLEVVGINNAASKGVFLDFSSYAISQKYIESIVFRVYVGADDNPSDGYPELRIPTPYAVNSWTMRYKMNDLTDQWVNVELKPTERMAECVEFATICTDGYLDKFELAVRHNKAGSVFYIDSIAINYLENNAPVITYNGEDHVTVAQGQALNFDVSAHDDFDGDVEIEYVWGDPSKLDENGNPLPGEHTLTFTATDSLGKSSTLTISVTVIEPDLNAPEFSVPTDKIYVRTGTTPLINVSATDDVDGDVEVVQTWSEGALDEKGRLTEGVHVLTLTATDSSNNSTVKAITFYVSENGNYFDNVVDEEELCPDEESEEESQSDSESVIESETESESKSESVKESEKQSQSKKESQKESTSKKESNKDSESEQDSQKSSANSNQSAGCTGSMGTLAIIGGLVIVAVVFLIIKRRRF